MEVGRRGLRDRKGCAARCCFRTVSEQPRDASERSSRAEEF